MTIDVEINGIKRKQSNCEYYYYLSTNKSESNIANWIKIKESQTSSDKLTFTINSNDISNMDELMEADNLYLYIKEIVTDGESKSTLVSDAISIDSKKEVDVYVNNAEVNNQNSGNKVDNKQNENRDDTVMGSVLPQTGTQVLIFACIIVGLIILTVIFARRLKKYNEK